MDRRTSPPQRTLPANLPTGPGPDPEPCEGNPQQGGKILELGRAFLKTIRHFWPQLNQWLEGLPDTRAEEMIVYDPRFLCWWGLLLFCLKLGSRRQLDFQLADLELAVLENVNRLAQTQQDSLPVNKTLSHYLSHVGSAAFADLRTQCVRRLIRNKVLDFARLEGAFPVAVDGTGFLVFKEEHCAHCLVRTHESGATYLHPVLEAKLVEPSGLALSLSTEFIENTQAGQHPAFSDYEQVKQDCELNASRRPA